MGTNESTQQFSSLYEANRVNLISETPDFYTKLRDDAIRYFNDIGFPAKKDEKYRYTFLEPIFNNGYKKNLSPNPISFDISDIFKCDVPSLDTHIVILLNGFYYNWRKPLTTLPNGIIYGSFAAALKQYPELVEKNVARQAAVSDSFLAINTAFSSDGFFLYAPKGSALDKPIQLINVLLSDEELMVQPRNLFILEEGSDVKLVVCDHTLSDPKFLTNSVTEVEVGENAHFDYFKVQNEHNASTQVSHTYIRQQANSQVQSMVVTLHGGVVRNNLNIKLDGEGAECHAYGLFITDKTQHVDNYVFIDHAKPNCTSTQLYKGVLDEQSTGAFTGKILVDRDSQKTLAYQKNSSLLLTNDAKMAGKPQLEIYADDVKCSHGATVGQLDEEALFYLRSRGISERESRLMLMYAFAFQVLHEIKIEPLQIRMNELIDKRLRGELSRCNNCAMNCK
jgi:Fe-S cluster assembly protein SufD